MTSQMKVLLDERGKDGVPTGSRRAVYAQLLLERDTTVVVRLPDGNVITRKKKRDIPSTGESDETV